VGLVGICGVVDQGAQVWYFITRHGDLQSDTLHYLRTHSITDGLFPLCDAIGLIFGKKAGKLIISDLDKFDRAILQEMARDGRVSITELSRRIGLSKSPTQARLRRLEEMGAIQGYRALLDPIRLGLDHIAFVEVKMTHTRESALAAFNEAVAQIPEIEQAHLIAGNFDYLLKVRTANMRSYRKVLAERISTLPHVASTSTYVAMQAVKEETFGNVT
jgi:Lrp/AsnC family leucine-responsive transcriptional regulator